MPRASHRTRNLGIVGGAVAVGLVIIGAIVASGVGTPIISITGVNLMIDYAGSTSGYLGPSSQAINVSLSVKQGAKFTETLTLRSQALLLTHSIASINVTTPGFSLTAISPVLPYSLSPGSSVTITLTMVAPGSGYNGPLGVEIFTR